VDTNVIEYILLKPNKVQKELAPYYYVIVDYSKIYRDSFKTQFQDHALQDFMKWCLSNPDSVNEKTAII